MEKPPSRSHEQRVVARDGDVVEEDVAVGRAADRRALPLEREVSPARPPPERTTSAGPSIPISSSGAVVLVDLLGRVGHASCRRRPRPRTRSAPHFWQ